MKLKLRLWYCLISIDQVLNTLLGSGYADETLSAHAYRNKDWRMKLINKLFFWQKEHCRDAYYAELERRHLPRDYYVRKLSE